MLHTSWALQPSPDPNELARLGVDDDLLARLLYFRGVRSAAEARVFLSPTDQPLSDPFLLPGMDAAVARLRQALRRGETIAVYGDYDVDGLTGTALLADVIELLGGHVVTYIPHRAREGYGLHTSAIASLVEVGARLIVTVDCGSTALQELAATPAGVDVVVTDHHVVPPELPSAVAVVNPHRVDAPLAWREWAGVGVALKLAQALVAEVQGGDAAATLTPFLDLVALGTLADMVDVRGENRMLVARGLERLAAGARPGLSALLDRALPRGAPLDAESVTFALIPRLNAAGRVGDPTLALDLLRTKDAEEARLLVEELEGLNVLRRANVDEALERVRRQIDDAAIERPALVVADAIPVGVAGLVASRLVDALQRPVVVLELGERESRGSARSVAGLDIVEVLEACADLLTRFGGHRQAAGLALPNANLAPFVERFMSLVAARLRDAAPTPTVRAEAELPLDRPLWSLHERLRALEPHGTGNPAPLFLSRDLEVRELRPINGGHTLVRLRGRGPTHTALAFRQETLDIRVGDRVDVLYHLRRRERNGTFGIELLLQGIRRSS
ncbi:MAG TPA: single-stranded-DNA-specific exonuclease RecJ [Chloroflexota bacterium]